jgi:hypothetical protein
MTAVKAFWHQYLAPTLKFVAAAASINISGCTNKDKVIASFVTNKLIPVSWPSLDVYSEAYKVWQVGPDAASEDPVVPPVNAVSLPAAIEAPAVQQEAPAVQHEAHAVPFVQVTVPFVPPTAPSVAAVTSAGMDAALAEPGALAQILTLMSNKFQSRQASVDAGSSSKALVSPAVKHKEDTLKTFAAGGFVDPVSIDPMSLRFLEFKAPFASQGLETNSSGFMVVRQNTRLPDTSHIFEASRVLGGFGTLIEWCLNDDQKRFSATYVGEMLTLLNTVKEIDYITELSKGTFFKHFLLKHRGVPSLMEAYNTDTVLTFKFFVMQAQAVPPMPAFRDVAPAMRRGVKRNAGVGPSLASFSRSGPAVMSASAPRSSKGRSSSDKPCKSRCDPGFTCTYQDCVFSHACVSCGQNHPASACSSWDVAKGAAAMALIIPRRR